MTPVETLEPAPRARRTGGFVLPMVVIALAVMGVLAIAILATSGDEREASLAVQEGTRSFFAAEAGLNHVVAQWPDSNYDTKVVAAGSSYTFAWRTLPENGATYRAVIQRLEANGPISVTVDGRSAATRRGLRTIQAILHSVPGGPFKYALFGASPSLNSKFGAIPGPQTDSYDSRIGPYGGANQSLEGNVYTNGSIAINGPTYIGGNLSYGGGLTGSPTVSGTITSAAPYESNPSVPCPAGGYTASLPAPTGSGSISYSSVTGNLTIQQSGSSNPYVLTLTGTSYYFNTVKVKSGATLAVSAGTQHVDIYVEGLWQSDGSHINNVSRNPTLLTIWGCGSSTASPWTVMGGGQPDEDNQAYNGAYFAMHAPNHPVTTSHPYDMYGAIVGASFDDSPGAHIHYDKALGVGGGFTLIPGSWAEVAH